MADVAKIDGFDIPAAAATKEFFVPCVTGTDPVDNIDDYHAGFTVAAPTDEAFIEFYIPSDFSSITAVVLVVLAQNTATERLNLYSSYAAQGEAGDTHVESSLDVDTAVTDKLIYELSISGILSSLAANDYISIKVTGDADNTPPAVIALGVRFKYS